GRPRFDFSMTVSMKPLQSGLDVSLTDSNYMVHPGTSSVNYFLLFVIFIVDIPTEEDYTGSGGERPYRKEQPVKTWLTILTLANLAMAVTTGSLLSLAAAAACWAPLTVWAVLEGRQRTEEAVARGLGVRVLAHDWAGVLTVRGTCDTAKRRRLEDEWDVVVIE